MHGIADYEFVPHAHDLYLDYAVELGIPGALACLALLLVFFWACSRAVRDTNPTIAWPARGLGLSILAFLVFGIVDAIAPGYAADVIGSWLTARGLPDHLVDIGGELRVDGHKPRGSDWRVVLRG